MKTRRKLRQRTLPLDMGSILHPVSYERGKALLAKLVDTVREFTTIQTPRQ